MAENYRIDKLTGRVQGLIDNKSLAPDAIMPFNALFGDSYKDFTMTSLTLLPNPARKNKVESVSGSFKGYSVDLAGYYNLGYRSIYFRGANFGITSDQTIVRGYTLDVSGNIENIISSTSANSNGWNTLPITKNTASLKATYCFNAAGGEVWSPEYVVMKVPQFTDLHSTSFTLVENPARKAKEETLSGQFRGYTVNLSMLYDLGYRSIYFRGANSAISNTIVRGYTLDKDGNIENIISSTSANSNGWNTLPITKNTASLKATYCFNAAGGEVWTPEYVVMKVTSLTTRLIDLEVNGTTGGGTTPTTPTEVVNVSLPSDMYIMQGRTTQLFFRGFVDVINYLNYDLVIRCPIGNKFNRYYEVTPSSVGNYTLTLQVRDNNLKVITTATCVLHVLANPASPATNKNILCVGASATDTGYWPSELKRMLCATGGTPAGLSLPNITFVGRKSKSTSSGQVNLEATGGWTWSTYAGPGVKAVRFTVSGATGLSLDDVYQLVSGGNTCQYQIVEINVTEGVGNIRCVYYYASPSTADPAVTSGNLTKIIGGGASAIAFSNAEVENFSPFYYNGEVDFKNYADTHCNGAIDVIIFHLGVNSVLWEQIVVSDVIAQAKLLLDAFFVDFPDSKVIVSAIPLPSQDGGLGYLYSTNSTINQYGTLKKFQEYNNALASLAAEYSGKVLYCPSQMQMDSENIFPKTNKAVNTRMPTTTEVIGTNPTHPIQAGSQQLADAILRTLIRIL